LLTLRSSQFWGNVKNPAKDKDNGAKIGDWRSRVELTRKDKPRTPLFLFKVE
jgi:hypothetical protein